MSSRFDLIAWQLLQKPFADCTIHELQQLTIAHPYLAPAQYLLAKKMLLEERPEARAQMQKAALYYHQPAAFHAFLNSEFPEPELFYIEEATETETEVEPPLPIHLHLPGQHAINEKKETELPMHATIDVAPMEASSTLVTTEDAPEEIPIVEEKVPAPELSNGNEKVPTVPKQEASALPAFEPYHTIDYFASQGIKLSQEEVGKDKMGRQLKSFTEWLKTMKRLPATEQLSTLDPHAEQKVEHLAAHSVTESEIVTEAMAEVWLKQNNLDKAAAVYHKLSLSNPSKRAYFAAKLESLKKKV